MKNLKLLFLTLLSVLSFSLFSQTQVYVTNTTGPNICDGTATLDTTNINMTSIFWQGMGMIINQGSYMVTNLCPGTYSVTFTTNGTPVTLTFTIGAGNPCLNFTGYLTTTNSVDSLTCNGTITPTITNGTAPYTYSWSNGITTQMANNLCPGGYCCYVVDANGCTLQLCDTVGVQSPNYGDTLIINGGAICNTPLGSLTTSIENCVLDYNSIDTAYLSTVSIPTNPMDSLTVLWVLQDTNNICYSISSVYPQPNFLNGCYNFTIVLYCLQKNTNIKTLIVNDGFDFTLIGINELKPKKKQLMSVVDLMGREVKPQPNKFLIYTYTDGSKEIKYINE